MGRRYATLEGRVALMPHIIGKDGLMHDTLNGSTKEFWAFLGAAFMAGFLFCYFIYVPCQLTEATATMLDSKAPVTQARR